MRLWPWRQRLLLRYSTICGAGGIAVRLVRPYNPAQRSASAPKVPQSPELGGVPFQCVVPVRHLPEPAVPARLSSPFAREPALTDGTARARRGPPPRRRLRGSRPAPSRPARLARLRPASPARLRTRRSRPASRHLPHGSLCQRTGPPGLDGTASAEAVPRQPARPVPPCETGPPRQGTCGGCATSWALASWTA